MDRSIIALLGLNTVLEYPENKGPDKGMKETVAYIRLLAWTGRFFLCALKRAMKAT